MTRANMLCLLLAMLLALAGCLPLLAEDAAADVVVEEIEVFLGEEPPTEEGAPPAAPEAPVEMSADDEAGGALTGLSLPEKLVIGVGETVALAPVRTPSNAACALSYATSKKKCVAVDESGAITGRKKGVATVTVTAEGGVSASVEVTVMAAPKSVTLEAPATAGIGDRFGCSVTFNKKAGGGYALASDDAAVLRVEADGTVSALAVGAAHLTVTTYNGRQSTAQVRVLAAPTAMWLDPTEARLGLGGTLALTCAMPEGSGGSVRYESSNAQVAAVDAATGVVRGVALGDAVITARSYNGLEDRCAVRVLPAPERLAAPSDSVVLGVGDQAQLQITPVPEGSACSLTYKSGKPKVASVSESGVVTALKKGKSVVTVTAQNGMKVKIKVQVLAAPTTVSLQVERANLSVGETTKAQAVLPKKTAALLTFSADDTGVISVDQSGTVTALSEGTANVYVKTSNGLTASAKITVGAPQEDAGEEHAAVSGPFEITFMNIERNDGILIHCGGEWAFIDSGYYGHGVQAVEFMRAQGVDKLKYYIASHAHEDHIGGAPVILAAFPVDQVLVAHDRVPPTILGFAKTDAEKAAAQSANYRVVTRGETFFLGGAEFKVLGPVRVIRCKPDKSKENFNSLILRVTYGSNTFLLTGDGTKKEFKEIEAVDPGCLRAQVFKNPHHQSSASYAASLAMPEITVLSTSRSDRPSSKYLSFLKKLGTKLYSTASNRHGHVKIVSDGKNLSVTTQYEYVFW